MTTTIIDTWMPNVVASDLIRMTPEQLAYLATYLVKHYPTVADKFQADLGAAFFEDNH